ncbi:NACHT and WD repeat domain-containing protein [Nocardia africana]|uniref:Uncharacterized protein containing caspase domain n=1 Tax=Nocardia africana TaxID=134964 RepID=A0A378WQZ5_9NOCA|nr:AAA family ATPase [Nocardia africana]MCC3314558.1 AAA family ATPase [Nocardia africana]SUA43167.1 Uncharacterized protein containing caspase domain [Nocardia africana]
MESAPPRRGRPRSSPRTLFSQRFAELFAAAGNPTLRRVAAAADARMRATRGPGQKSPVSVQRLSDWKAGRNVPARFESLLPVLLTLIDEARKSSGPVTPSLLDLHQWQQLWTASNDWDPNSEGADVVCPYLGLASYRSEDADVFFGRARHTADLVGLIRATAEGDGGLVVLVGASGAGKSSLLHAGVLPALTDSEPVWAIATMTPGPDPMRALLSAVNSEGSTPGDPDITDVVGSIPDAVAEWASAGRRILVVDQMEELFTLCGEERKRAEFLAVLEHLAIGNEHGPVAVVAAIRADFYARCLDEPVLEDALKHRSYLLGPMRLDELADAITRPADIAGYKLESGLEELVISELCGLGGGGDRRSYDPGALPLVSHVMEAVWERRDGSRLTIEGYRAAGGVLGSVAATAERAWNELSDFQRAVGKQVLLGLVAVGDDSRDTRRKVSRAELLTRTVDAVDAALDALARTRLITLDADSAYLTHEIVLDAWPRLRSWIDDDRVGYLERQRLHTDAADWSEHDRDPSLLYRGARLTTMRDHARNAALGPVAAEFLAASESARTRAQRRATARRSALAVLTVVSLALAGVAFVQSHNASHERDGAFFRSVLAEADRAESSDPSLSAQLALVAYRMKPDDRDARARVVSAGSMPLAAQLQGHGGWVEATIISSDGRLMASAGSDKAIRLWDISDRSRPQQIGVLMTGGTERVEELAFSPSGTILVSHDQDGPVRLWDVHDPRRPAQLSGPIPGGYARGLAFDPDGKVLLMAVKDRSINGVDLSDPAHPVVRNVVIPAPPPGSEYDMVRFSADMRRAVTLGFSGQVQLWQVNRLTDTAVSQVRLADHAVSLAIRPDGTRAAISVGRTVEMWNISAPNRPERETEPISGSGSSMFSPLAFRADGRVLADTDGGGVVRLWDISNPGHPVAFGRQLSGPKGYLSAVAFSPDGADLVAAGQDGVIRLWSLARGVGENWPHGRLVAVRDNRVAVVNGSAIEVWSLDSPTAAHRIGQVDLGDYGRAWLHVSISPDGRKMLVLSGFRNPELFAIGGVPAIRSLGQLPMDSPIGVSGAVLDRVAFNHRSDRAVIVGRTNSIAWFQLWDTSDAPQPSVLSPRIPVSADKFTYVWSSNFGSDDKTLVLPQVNGIVGLWSVADPAHPRRTGEIRAGQAQSGLRVVLAPDGRTVVTAGDDQLLRMWDISDPAHPEQIGEPLPGHSSMLSALALSPDGKTLASSDRTGTRIWDISDRYHPRGADHAMINADEGGDDSSAFYPDGKHLVGATADGTVHVWDLDTEHAVDRICSTTRSVLTEEVWREHLPQLKYRPPCE